MPERIQAKRSRGWRKPPGAVYVGRPTKWGNPARVGRDMTAAEAVEAYREYIAEAISENPERFDLEELRGKVLMCWCKPGEPCHADVLLELANAPRKSEEITP